MDVVVQKPKSKMLTDVEVDIIRDFMFTHKEELESSHAAGGPGAARRSRDLWAKLTQEVNAVGVSLRSTEQIRQKWRNMVDLDLVNFFFYFNNTKLCRHILTG